MSTRDSVISSTNNLSKFRLLILAMGIAAVLELMALMFAFQASDPLYAASHWIIYHGVNFAEITDIQLKIKARQNQILDMLLTYLYFSVGLIVPLTIFKWARLRLRLLISVLIIAGIMFLRFILVGSVFD
jgi:hypothetical protein